MFVVMAQETYNDYPKAAQENAKRALKFREETNNLNGCGTPVGWARANQLAKGEPISFDTIKRMASFNRHRQNKDVPYEDGCGGLMWDAWGGTEGVDWAIRKAEQIRKEMEAQAALSFDIMSDIIDSENEINGLKDMLASADGQPVSINIASDGGEVFTGLKMAALIESYKGQTTANIYGLAASIATIIALAADKVLINEFGFFMIHNSWAFFQGNRDEVKKQTKVLKEIDDLLANVYTSKIKKSGKLINGSYEETKAKIIGLMAQETFLSSSKALEFGLVDGYLNNPIAAYEKTALSNISNKLHFYNKLPKEFLNMDSNKKGIFAAIASLFGFSKDEAIQAIETLPEAEKDAENENADVLEPMNATADKKAMEDEEKTDDEKKKMEELEKQVKAMEEEKKALSDEIAELKDAIKAMEEKEKKMQASIENTAAYALDTEPKKDSIFSADVQKKLNEAFNKAFKK